MKYTKKYNKRRKPNTQKKRPKRKSRKHAKKRGGGLFSKKDVETKQQQLNAFNREFPYENDTYGKKNIKPIYKIDNIIGESKDNIFSRFNDLYNELRGPTLECSNKKYKDYDECQNEKIEYYRDLFDVLYTINNKLNDTILENSPARKGSVYIEGTEGLTKVDEYGEEVNYVLTPEDFVKIRKMKKQIKELTRNASTKIDEHKSKSKSGNVDEEKEAKEKEKQRVDDLYKFAANYKKKLQQEKGV